MKWKPEWDVRCQYPVFFTKTDGSDFKVLARCDADGDGDYAQFQMDKECFVFQSSGQFFFNRPSVTQTMTVQQLEIDTQRHSKPYKQNEMDLFMKIGFPQSDQIYC